MIYAINATGPFYRGTRADLAPGDLLTPRSHLQLRRPQAVVDLLLRHARRGDLGCELAKGAGRERIYLVEPTGAFEDDPNLTDKRFPGNPTQSYRSRERLRVVGEVEHWEPHSPGVSPR
ncbi:MAG TPA: NAD(+)--rifampin ADP-ribosyltransferase [Croceibacterium sp.]